MTARTHCKHGHPWTERNVYSSGGKRQCRVCMRLRRCSACCRCRGELDGAHPSYCKACDAARKRKSYVPRKRQHHVERVEPPLRAGPLYPRLAQFMKDARKQLEAA